MIEWMSSILYAKNIFFDKQCKLILILPEWNEVYEAKLWDT